ncbi:hypothetical protein [Caulobacter endophyticus]|uniref:EF-hand domain-containing protein n=1 Tax=Caulobacter endophyticus TaxID=2172652 RepID=A0A2T9K5N0_9CAUL|nr:hypothetical protein [Caulobacter endophyticus]PVM91270.1 hypothetical protein DDF67_07230 [Caulobacter endophyticus]
MIRIAALALPLLLSAAPGLAAAQAAPAPVRLMLNAADLDGDGAVSAEEAAQRLAATTTEELPAAVQPASLDKRLPVRFAPRDERDESGFPALAMKRRFVEASEFEQALEYRFQEELKERRKQR